MRRDHRHRSQPLNHSRPRHHTGIRLLFAIATLALLSLASACAGVVVEPVDDAVVPNVHATLVHGWAVNADQDVRIEAQNNANNWVEIRAVRSATTPTYGESNTGYYWSAVIDLTALPPQLRFPVS